MKKRNIACKRGGLGYSGFAKVMENLLEKLFEAPEKIRLLRLFLRNPVTSFTLEEVLKLTGLSKRVAERELGKLMKLGFIHWRNAQMVISQMKQKGEARKIKMQERTVRVYTANQSFDFFRELRDLILRQVPEPRHKLLQKIRKVGKVKLAIAAGAFINSENSRVDLFIVGENVSRRRIEGLMTRWEANAGRPLTYALMSTDEFKYRMDMFDRFTRDVLESPHDKLINALNIA